MITDKQKSLLELYNDEQKLLLLLYYDRGVLKKEIRSYEVSLWTLQDEFITVLKWSDVEQKGRIEDPIMTLRTDGTLTFKFSIPMYYRVYNHPDPNYTDAGKLIENPNWYNTLNGNLMVGLRKIKVIFNKEEIMTAEDRTHNVFEFVITDINESHDGDILTCEIEASGLAFLELGKIGYKINLSFDTFDLEEKAWSEGPNSSDLSKKPAATVDYWCEKIGLIKWTNDDTNRNPLAWYYKVEMNWDSFSYVDSDALRSSDKVYEDPYNVAWDANLNPTLTENAKEKERIISADKSNIYNITLTIAETFEIFCRYEYGYDENYHIISKTVVFYNNFVNEDFESITYPYSATKVSRTMDSKDVTTKLYVLDVDNASTIAGISSMMNSPANPTKEDYILNFDYMYKTGAITKEAYDSVREYEKSIKAKNEDIIRLLLKLAVYERRLPEYKGKLTTYTNSIALDKELIVNNNALLLLLQNKYGTEESNYLLVRDGANAQSYRIPDSGEISIKELGIDASTIHAYTVSKGKLLSDEVDILPITDEANNVIGIKIKDMSLLVIRSKPDWSKVFSSEYNPTESNSKGYTPLEYKGNVDLSIRPIVPIANVPKEWFESEQDWNDAVQSGAYATLQSSAETVSLDDKNYYLIYTPILADGTVLTPTEFEAYLSELLDRVTTIDLLMSADKNGKKLFLHYKIDDGTEDGTWETALHNRQEEWDKIRAANNWFGYNSNPNNVAISTDISSLNYYPTVENIVESTKFLYLTYHYDPHLYYELIIKMWQTKLAQDQENKRMYDSRVDLLTLRIEYDKALIEAIIDEKQNIIKEFERMMGPALREGYWQPDNYNDYGEHHHLSVTMPYSDNDAELFWDENKFEEEETAYYEIGVANSDSNSEGLPREYYPCIRLDTLYGNNIPTDLDTYSVVWWANKNTNFSSEEVHWNSIKDLLIFSVGSLALFRYVKYNGANIPVLMLVGAKTLPEDLLQRLTTPAEGHARLEKYSVEVDEETREVTISHTNPLGIGAGHWILTSSESNLKPEMIYPRIKFTSSNIKTDTTNLVIKYASNKLEIGTHYSSSIQYDDNGEQANPIFYITIKPELFISYGTAATWEINYVLSNADTAIYLDALKVSKENAIPKVSYDISVNAVNEELSHDLHKKLAQIVMINDTDLKFENTFGYISELELHLDKVYEDNIKIQNYKTKFEDLFSTIIAQTEAMKLSSASFDSAVSGDTALSENGLMQSIAENRDIFDAYLDAHFDSSQVVIDKLTELFNEAGKVLGSAGKSLDSLKALNDKNAAILAGFIDDVGKEITVETFRLPNRPETFKLGDIWIKTDENNLEVARYLATQGSDTISSEEAASETSGFIRTFDATLASIKGAALDIDAVAGIIDIKAQNQINIKSGNNISIAANDTVDIYGNKSVNIGGTTINIGSTSSATQDYGGINLIAASYSEVGKNTGDTTLSKVLISPKKIEMGSADILMRGANKILMIASRGTAANTSAVEISSNNGVWIGSGKGVTLFSGGFNYNESTHLLSPVSAAAIELNANHLLLGFSTDTNALAIEMKNNYLIIASGDIVNSDSSKKGTGITGTSSGLVGAKFTQNSIGLATGSGANINAILMNDKGITIGSGSIDVTVPTTSNDGNNLRASTGSYVRIAGSGIELGSLANLYVNMNNFKLLTDPINGNMTTRFAVGTGLNEIKDENNTTITNLSLVNENSTGYVGMVFNGTNLFVKGIIYASGGSFTGAINASSFILNDPNGYKVTYYYMISTSGSSHPAENDSSWTSSLTPTSSDAGKYLWTKTVTTVGTINTVTYSTLYISANGTTLTLIIDYGVSTSSNPSSISIWRTDYNTVAENWNTTNLYLITRTRIYVSGTWNTNYTITRYAKDGDPGKYITTVELLYYLYKVTSPSDPTNNSIYTTDGVDKWTTVVPTWVSDAIAYYRSARNTWSDSSVTFENKYIDYGLTVANEHATAASTAAQDAATKVTPIAGYGLIGNDINKKNSTVNGVQYDANGYPMWGNESYGLILGNNLDKPMLIGGNSGVTIVDTYNASGNGSAISLKEGGIGLYGSSSIILKTSSGDTNNAVIIDHSGITIGTNKKLVVQTANVKINPDATNNDPIFEVGSTSGNYLSYKGTNLEIKGNIVATSFSLSGTATTEFNSAVSNAIGSGDFGRNGVGWEQWPRNSGNYYVSLTATSDNLDVKGILIGVSDSANLILHLIVPWSATSSKTVVDISKNGIFFDANLIEEIWPDGGVQFTRNGLWQDNNTRFFDTGTNDYVKGNYLYYNGNMYYFDSNGYKLTDNTIYEGNRLKYFYFNSNGEFVSPHITINSNGIEFGGASLKLNGRELWGSDIWGRDNIIIMNPNATGDDVWRKTVSSIELYMGIGTGSAKHDWVLIKPFYNAKISYNKSAFLHLSASSGREISLITVTKNSINDSFGNGAESYKYTFILDIYNDTNTAITITAITIRVQIGDTSYTFNNSGTPHGTITDFPRALAAKNVNENLKIELTSNVNLSDDTAYSMTWYATFSFTGGSYITFADGTTERFKSFVGETNATNSRVPCTVYYYP